MKRKLTALAFLPLFVCASFPVGAQINATISGVGNQRIAGQIAAPFNDPTNTSGLGASAIQNGVINMALVSGVTVGSGQTTTTRQNTATAMNSAVTYAENHGLALHIPAGIYEINNSLGLQFGFTAAITVYGDGGRGTLTRIIQYNTNVPVCTVGQVTNYIFGYKLSGISCEYGVSQGTVSIAGSITASSTSMTSVSPTSGYSNGTTIIGPGIPSGTTISSGAGTATLTLSHAATYTASTFTAFSVLVSTTNTSANTFVIGALSESVIDDINVGSSNLSFSGYRGVYNNATNGTFVNIFSNFEVIGAQQELVNWGSSENDHWQQWFCRTGPGLSSGPSALNGSYAWNFSSVVDGGIMERINIEATAVNNAFHTENVRGMVFQDIHLETYWMTGSTPALFYTSSSRFNVNNLDMDFVLTTQGGASSYGRFTTTYGGDAISITNTRIVSQSTDSGAANLNFVMIDGTTNTPDSPPIVNIKNLVVDDFNGGGIASRVYMSGEMPIASFASPSYVTEYQFNGTMSWRRGATIAVSSTYTVFGAEQNPTVLVPVSITSFTLTLSDSWDYGAGSAKPVYGSIIHVRRAAGTPSGTLTIKDGGGTTLTTNTTAAADLYYQFNGTAWAAVT